MSALRVVFFFGVVMNFKNVFFASALLLPFVAMAQEEAANPADAVNTQSKSLGVVTVTSGQPTSLPTQIPTTMEGITKEQIQKTINATDSEDALRYFPSLLVRKRYIGDYNHAVLSSRASGTGNSARSAVYADGILLSNYLGNGATYAPRWGLVTPEEIERVDVMYGPFSAAYHLMLLGLKQPLKDGDRFPVWLTFKRSGEVKVEVYVQTPKAPAQSEQHQH